MEGNEEIKEMIKLVQTSLHDQISALKSDVNRAVGDSETVLEISATLEKSMQLFVSGKVQLDKLVETNSKMIQLLQSEIQDTQLDLKRVRMIAGTNNYCFNLCRWRFKNYELY